MSWRIVVERAKDLIPQALVERSGLEAERVEMRVPASTFSCGVFKRLHQLPSISTAAEEIRDPHQPNEQPIPVDVSPHAPHQSAVLITHEHPDRFEPRYLCVGERMGGQPPRENLDIFTSWSIFDCKRIRCHDITSECSDVR